MLSLSSSFNGDSFVIRKLKTNELRQRILMRVVKLKSNKKFILNILPNLFGTAFSAIDHFSAAVQKKLNK